MSSKMKRTIIVLIVFVISTILSVCMLYNSDKILVNFDIIKLTNNYTEYYLEFTKVKAADHYVIQINNSNNRKVFELETKEVKNKFSLTNLKYNEEYSLMVFAYDELGDYRPCEEEYKFVWNEPTFKEDSSLLLNNSDYTLFIDGDLSGKEYYLNVKDNEQVYLNELVDKNEVIISSTIYQNLEKELVVTLNSNNEIVDEIHLFNNMNPVSDLSITNVTNDTIVPFNDLTLSYSGGDNALEYEIRVIKDKKIIRQSTTSKKTVVLSKNLFKVGEAYSLEVVGKYDSYFKSSIVNITMSDLIQLNPVYISNNWKYVKKGTKLELESSDEDVKIYYTLDGNDPESFGILYTEPIVINENVTLKTVSMKDGYLDSVISTYDINVGEKKKLSVYLSPSNQHGNLGVKSVGFTNEMDEMNDVTNYIQERLEKNGVKVYRNNSAGNINQWNRDSNYYGVDFKIAIHSNASIEHDKYGIETWIDTQNSTTLSIANKIQNGLMSIYPYKDKPNANRGVKYANGALGEANDNYIPFGILVEVAHHDNKEDAEWIMQNKKLIGYNIADSILKYYQVIE